MDLLGSFFHSFPGAMQSTHSPWVTVCWLLLMDDPRPEPSQPCQPEAAVLAQS